MCHIWPYQFIFRFLEGSEFMLRVDVMHRKVRQLDVSLIKCPCASRALELIMFGNKSEQVTLNNGPSGFKNLKCGV